MLSFLQPNASASLLWIADGLGVKAPDLFGKAKL